MSCAVRSVRALGWAVQLGEYTGAWLRAQEAQHGRLRETREHAPGLALECGVITKFQPVHLDAPILFGI